MSFTRRLSWACLFVVAAFLFVIASLSAGCTQHRSAPGEAVADVCVPANDGAIVSVSGYLAPYVAPPPGVADCDADSCPFTLAASGRSPLGATVVRIGFAERHAPRLRWVSKRKSYGTRKVILRDDKDEDFGFGDVIRVTGVVHVVPIGDGGRVSCTILRPRSVRAL